MKNYNREVVRVISDEDIKDTFNLIFFSNLQCVLVPSGIPIIDMIFSVLEVEVID